MLKWLTKTALVENIVTGIALGMVVLHVGRAIKHAESWRESLDYVGSWSATAIWSQVAAKSNRAAMKAQDTMELMDRANKSLVILLNHRTNPALRQ